MKIPNLQLLTCQRVETHEHECTARTLALIQKSAKADLPCFLRLSSTRLHMKTHLFPRWENKARYGLAADGIAALDKA
jgi:hypothetical protein